MELFDELTYKGRFQKFLELTNVKHLLHSTKTIQRCQQSMKTKPTKRCAEIVAACVHPTTKEIMPVYGRMAFFFPINIPICSGMLLTRPTLINLIGWQWFNQTYNAIFNYSNSAGSIAKSGKKNSEQLDAMKKGYIGSVLMSVGIAVGLTQWVKRGKISPFFKPLLQKTVPFVATSSAGVANVVLMRSEELKTGIPVTTMDGTYIGHSKLASRKALLETAISRAVMPIPMLLLPTPIIALFSKLSIFQSSFLRQKLMELTLLSTSIAIGLPAALAVFPQYTKVPFKNLESEFQSSKDIDLIGEYVKYNKGV